MAYTIKGVDPALNATIAAVEKKSGPNQFLRMMAHQPDAVQPFLGLYKAVMGPGMLERRLKEMVYLAVSYVNECAYCTADHIAGARRAGLSDSEIREIETENNQHFTPKEQAALRYARELTRMATVEENTRYEVQELFSTEQTVELTMVVSMANFTNRFNNSLKTPLEA